MWEWVGVSGWVSLCIGNIGGWVDIGCGGVEDVGGGYTGQRTLSRSCSVLLPCFSGRVSHAAVLGTPDDLAFKLPASSLGPHLALGVLGLQVHPTASFFYAFQCSGLHGKLFYPLTHLPGLLVQNSKEAAWVVLEQAMWALMLS